MIEPEHLRTEIRRVLKYLDPEIPYSEAAENLLCMTAAHESLCGRWLYQRGGPALGQFQMEPFTMNDILKWLEARPKLAAKVAGLKPPALPPSAALSACIAYAAALARVLYFRRPERLPGASDLRGLATYAKQHYNTKLGKAKIEDYHNRYVEFFG